MRMVDERQHRYCYLQNQHPMHCRLGIHFSMNLRNEWVSYLDLLSVLVTINLFFEIQDIGSSTYSSNYETQNKAIGPIILLSFGGLLHPVEQKFPLQYHLECPMHVWIYFFCVVSVVVVEAAIFLLSKSKKCYSTIPL